MTEESRSAQAGGTWSGDDSLAAWLREHGFLRGPHLYADYWASVLRLPGGIRERVVEAGLVDPALYRLGLDRPDLQLPRLRSYLALFLLGPLLLVLRRFRRLGRYRLGFRSDAGREVQERLAELELEIEPSDVGDGRVDVRGRGLTLAEGILDPRRISGFASLFFATYKLPLATLAGLVLAAVTAPLVHALGVFRPALDLWIPAGFPLLALLLYLAYRDVVTAVLGALPVVIVRYLLPFVRHGSPEGWRTFFLALGGLFLLYLLIDVFFMPRPVPPVLFLFARKGPGRAYEREGDAPWWLEGDCYWVWRYMALTPAEISKFWERDWERVELWIRADGEGAGRLEWIVTDGHYRELWVPGERLTAPDGSDEVAARAAAAGGRPGLWLLEADADLLFHSPAFRAATFLPEVEGVPARSLRHLAAVFWRRPARDDPAGPRRRLERARIRVGGDVFEDAPEVAAPLIARHLLSAPWRYWRYPLGAATRAESRLYGEHVRAPPPPAADPALQIKAPEENLDGLP